MVTDTGSPPAGRKRATRRANAKSRVVPIRGEPVLRAFLNDQQLCEIRRAALPAEEQPSARLRGEEATLTFIDSAGGKHSYDLVSVIEEGGRWLEFSIRVGPTHAVQADCLIGTDGRPTPEAFDAGTANGLRFQPFYLPECSGKPAELVGRGLFFRGLHFSGVITRGNVSLLCVCDLCSRSFRLQSFHAGFSNRVYFYCSNAPHTLTASAYLEDAPPLLNPPDPSALARFEAGLPDCARCGGNFRYLNPLRCPNCLGPYLDFRRYPQDRPIEYYGNCLYGEAAQEMEEPRARLT
jgi:hypothetical protein